MSRVFASIVAMAVAILPTPGFTQVRNVYWSFAEATTAQGCIAFIHYDKVDQTPDSQRKRTKLSWTGSGCTKGRSINGVGILRTTRDGKFTTLEKGRMIDGVFDGPVTLQIVGRGGASNQMMSMGCGVFDNGQPYGDCAPRPRPLTAIPATDRTDVLAACMGPINELAALPPATSIDETISGVTTGWLINNNVMTTDVESVKFQIARLNRLMATEPSAGNTVLRRVGRCLYERRLIQLNRRR